MILIKRRHVTLVEMLIVMAILALMAGVVTINIRRAHQQQRFHTEVDLMVDTLRFAQDLMLLLNTDVHVRVALAEKRRGLEYWVEVEEGIPKAWKPVIKRSHRLLTETHSITFLEDGEVKELDIKFLSGGSLMSRGVIRMSTHENPDAAGATNRAICLNGYPHPIVSIPEGDEPVECEDDKDEDFNDRLTYYTTQEILEDVPREKKKEDKDSEGT
ncbi:MAG: hypothetical protein K940chlam7_00380 [Chlamydiae bacterium]|nr:hypothetical protein [Chlamydiota bacterium]